jgi:hypothetical protein
MDTIQGYKLFRLRKDGTLGPLFINRKQVIPLGVTLEAQCLPTKGFAVRQGWHATLTKSAPHLSEKLASGEQRVWCKVLLEDCTYYDRPESQGGKWVLAKRLTVLEVVNDKPNPFTTAEHYSLHEYLSSGGPKTRMRRKANER